MQKYKEPNMPSSLKKLLDGDIEDSRQVKKTQYKKRPQKKKTAKRSEIKKTTSKPVRKTTRKPQQKRVPKKATKKVYRRKRPNKILWILKRVIGLLGILFIYIINISVDFIKVLFKVNNKKTLEN